MINKIEKVFYHKRTECLAVPWNISIKKIISDVIVLISKNMRFDIDETNSEGTARICAFTTGITKEEVITITPEEFEDFDAKKEIHVKIYPIWEFGVFPVHQKVCDSMIKNYDFYVVGSINCIDSSVVQNLRECFPWQSFMLYGDVLLDSPEYDNSTARYLTNVSYELRDNFDYNKISKNKKINIALGRLRCDDDQAFNKISVSNIVDILRADRVDINEVMSYIDDENTTVCVPRRFYAQLVNEVWYNKGYSSDLDFEIGSKYYVKYPYVTQRDSEEIVAVPVMSMIKITEINKSPIMINEHECYKCNVNVYDKEGNVIDYITDVLIDFSDYLLSFSNENFEYNNVDEFDHVSKLLSESKFFNLGNEIMCVQPFRIVIPEITKYFTCKRMVAYIEFIERYVGVRSDSNWFKYVCSATDEIKIRYTDEFI